MNQVTWPARPFVKQNLGTTRAEKVLIVEDEPTLAAALEQQLLRLGYRVCGLVTSGRAALAMAVTTRPDVVLMDIHLDGEMDGIETAASLRWSRGVPVVYVSSMADDATLTRARKTKPYGYLIKPYSERELHATLQMAIERARTERELQRGRQHLQLALSSARLGTLELDPVADELLCDDHAIELLEPQASAFGGWRSLIEAIAEADRGRVTAALDASLTQNKPFYVVFRALRSGRWCVLQGRPYDARGAKLHPRLIGVIKDAEQEREQSMQSREATALLDHVGDGVMVLDAAGGVLRSNAAFASMVHWPLHAPIGCSLVQGLPGELGDQLAAAVERLGTVGHSVVEIDARRGDATPLRARLQLIRLDGEMYDGEDVRILGVLSETPPARATELSLRDVATALPNRLLFNDRLDQAIIRGRRNEQSVALLSISVDGLEGPGHHSGSEPLRQAFVAAMAKRFGEVLRETDTLAHFETERFAVIAEGGLYRVDASRLAERLLAALEQPLEVDGCTRRVMGAIGVAYWPEHCGNAAALQRAADTALHAARQAEPGSFVLFSSGLAPLPSGDEPGQVLRHAIERGELRLHYQPQVDVVSRGIAGFEALLRWQHPERGLLGPEHLIPLAEECGLIVAIGDWVLDEALRQSRAWRDAGLPDCRMSINVSALQLRDQGLVSTLPALLSQHGVAAASIELEVTESALQRHSAAVLAQLLELGVSVAIDDFGTGHSGLSSIKHLPLSRCKIDRLFVSELPGNARDAAIAASIVSLSHELGLKVVAEGVETTEQAEFMATLGCDELQGYLYGRPLPPDQAAELLRAGGAAMASAPSEAAAAMPASATVH